jgi:hypothetical protein
MSPMAGALDELALRKDKVTFRRTHTLYVASCVPTRKLVLHQHVGVCQMNRWAALSLAPLLLSCLRVFGQDALFFPSLGQRLQGLFNQYVAWVP